MEKYRRYLSMDLESTGLEDDCYLIQLAMVPVDVDNQVVKEEWAEEVYIHCPSFEELKPKLTKWVINHNEDLIRKANAEGLSNDSFKTWMVQYLERKEITEFFYDRTPVILGKSLSALDLPLLHRYLGPGFMREYFHHHTLDITCIARALSDMGHLPRGCYGTTSLLQHFEMRDISNHTALSDAVDMAKIYFKLIDKMESEPDLDL